MKVQKMINVTYKHTSNPETAKKWLSEISSMFAADFETAVKYSKEDQEMAAKRSVDLQYPKKERIQYQAIANATALSHPSHCITTHCSIATSSDNAYVFIIDSQEMAETVIGFLCTTKLKQIWHNYCFDGKYIRYYGGKDANDVEDTQILAKTLLNHVEILKAKTSLKELMGGWYGDWGISADNFSIDQQHDPKVIKYAAIDACATFKLWEYLIEYIIEHSEK